MMLQSGVRRFGETITTGITGINSAMHLRGDRHQDLDLDKQSLEALDYAAGEITKFCASLLLYVFVCVSLRESASKRRDGR